MVFSFFSTKKQSKTSFVSTRFTIQPSLGQDGGGVKVKDHLLLVGDPSIVIVLFSDERSV